MPRDTYYEVLEIDAQATGVAVRVAFLRLAKKHHPDVSRAADAEARMKELNEAYNALSDPVLRNEYDQSIGLAEPATTGAPPPSGGGHDTWTEQHAVHSEEEAFVVGCQVCGRVDSTVRFSIFI